MGNNRSLVGPPTDACPPTRTRAPLLLQRVATRPLTRASLRKPPARPPSPSHGSRWCSSSLRLPWSCLTGLPYPVSICIPLGPFHPECKPCRSGCDLWVWRRESLAAACLWWRPVLFLRASDPVFLCCRYQHRERKANKDDDSASSEPSTTEEFVYTRALARTPVT
jgi:hypothetical protein